MVVVLASGAVACGGLLGIGAEEEDVPAPAAHADAARETEGDTTVLVDDSDGGDGGSDGAARDADAGFDAGAGCQGDPGCTRYAFVTSTTHLGTLLGLSGADTICNTRKAANPLLANRTFVAWISTQTKNAKDRFAATAPIRRVDGTVIASSLADLLQNGPQAPLSLDEKGSVVIDTDEVFTGTQNDGVVNNDCEGWSNADSPAKVGSALASKSGNWTDDATLNCSEKARVYCFEY